MLTLGRNTLNPIDEGGDDILNDGRAWVKILSEDSIAPLSAYKHCRTG